MVGFELRQSAADYVGVIRSVRCRQVMGDSVLSLCGMAAKVNSPIVLLRRLSSLAPHAEDCVLKCYPFRTSVSLCKLIRD